MLVIPMPWAGTTGSARAVVTWPTGSARAVVSWTTGTTGTTGTAVSAWTTGAGAARATGSARIIGSGRGVEASGRRPAMVTAGSSRRRRAMAAGRSRRRSWSGVCRTGAHTHGRCAKSAGDGYPRSHLLQFHGPASKFLEHCPPTCTKAR
jgi:hypothetical protein